MKRREAVKAAILAPIGVAAFSEHDGMRAALHALAALEQQGSPQGAPYRPKYFRPDEWKQVRILVDLIIPRDERSGSATEAAVPEFMDFICAEYPSYSWMREALRWLDGFAYDTHSRAFANLSDSHRRELLDQIAWPKKAKPELAEGVAHFNRLRDFTASGFWSSQMGVKDLQYVGNTPLAEWKGCPKPALDKLGVRYT